MRTFTIELRKEKRTGIIPLMLAVGILGAAYAFVNFIVRKDTLLNLPLAPMDVLLTQLYGMIMVLNMFGIIVAACMIYNMEFKGSAIKKMPESVSLTSKLFGIKLFAVNESAMSVFCKTIPNNPVKMARFARVPLYRNPQFRYSAVGCPTGQNLQRHNIHA